MKIRAGIVIMSHLSDAQEELRTPRISTNLIQEHINFAKWILLKYPNTEVEIDADTEYELFLKNQK